jgi:quinol-cytochrome oxidoreductase complex cytochrome b subunit
LVLFYAFHTSLIPISLLALMGFHFWRVRKARGVVVPHPIGQPRDEEAQYVPAYPDLLVRELSAGLVLMAAVLMLAVFFDAPLGEPANPGMSPNPAKAPWYFMGFQELQLHFHPVLAVVVVPLLATVALVVLPYLDYDEKPSGPWFLTVRGRRLSGFVALAACIVVPGLIILDDFVLRPTAGAPSFLGRGLVPLAALAVSALGMRAAFLKKLSASRAEVAQALFTLFAVALVILTLTGVFCRGEGMRLTWWWRGE